MRTTFDTSKISKLQGSGMSSILSKSQKIMETQHSIWYPQPNFKNHGEATFSRYPKKQSFWKSKEATLSRYLHPNCEEATFHRYSQPNDQRGDIPLILAKLFSREVMLSLYLHSNHEEATFHRYSTPNKQGGDIPSILAIPFSREAIFSRYLHFF